MRLARASTLICGLLLACLGLQAAGRDILLADFESQTYGDGMVTGEVSTQSREFLIGKHYLNLPIKNGAQLRKVTVLVEDHPVRKLDIELADEVPDWWAVLDVSPWGGKRLSLRVDRLPGGSLALSAIEQSNQIKGSGELYRELLRPQFHFSSRRGWNNDPNGLVFYLGEYHLFYQHNPFGWDWGNMHWGHAISRDLVHWKEFDDVLVPDDLGPMFSGSAVVDWKNTSGFGKRGQPPLVLAYTAAGNPTVQCLAYSTDRRKFTKYRQNPVVTQITSGNRDPKVIWYEPTKTWVMVLYVGLADESKKNDKRRPQPKHTIHFLTSPDLMTWKVQSFTEGFFECPDFFELPIDGEAQNRKWALTAASSEYMVGRFDGVRFAAETSKLPGHRGSGFYAAQTFSDIPPEDGRRIQIGWLQAPSPGMPFNQCMSLPMELTLRSTPEGPRLARWPVKELESLRKKSYRLGPFVLKPADNPLSRLRGELWEVRAEFAPGGAEEIGFHISGASVLYDSKKQEVDVNGHRAPAPLRDGRQRLAIYLDRTALEVFLSDGLTYVPMPLIPKAEEQSLEVFAKGGSAEFQALELYELKSAW